MSAEHDLRRRLADHYDTVAPRRAPDWVLRSALQTIETTPQRRGLLARWRFPTMTTQGRLLAAIVAVTAVALVGFALVTGFGNSSRPTAAPTSATATQRPAATDARERATGFRRPFTFVLPDDVQTDYGPRTDTFLEIRVPDSSGEGQAAWFLIVQAIEGGRADPCDGTSADASVAGARAALDYLQGVPGISVVEQTPVEIDGRQALAATLALEAPTTGCEELSLWASDVEALPEDFRDPATVGRVFLLDVDGEAIAIHTWATREALDWERWSDEIVDSIDFDPPGGG